MAYIRILQRKKQVYRHRGNREYKNGQNQFRTVVFQESSIVINPVYVHSTITYCIHVLINVVYKIFLKTILERGD